MTITAPPAAAALTGTAPDLEEITIAAGDDTICAVCETPLPAGAPAWPDGDGGVLCADDVPEISEGE